MKKIVILFILIFTANFTFSQENKIPKEKLETLKRFYNWNDEKLLIVNFYLPKNSCHYNQYNDLKSGKKWIENNIYKNIELNNIKNIFIYSESQEAKSIIDNISCFFDYENYFLNTFFNVKNHCYGIVVINENGNFIHKLGEFSKYDVKRLINKVNK